MTIQNVQVEGSSGVSESLVESKVRDDLSGKYWRFISRANSLFYPGQKIETDILNSFPSVENVSVSRPDFHTLLIEVSERKPIALWCEGNTVSVPPQDTPCFLMDKDGLIFAKAPSTLPEGFLYYFGGEMKEGNPIGQTFLDGEKIQNLSFFLGLLPRLHLKPVALLADPNDELELYVEGGLKILLRSDMSYDVALQNFESLWNDPALGWAQKGIPSTLQYIDLRFDNKVFYK
ncbi:MAG: hypothetical protein PHV42_03745 [Candidatus Pacebacteria bacterium]|nr:hypothetical protein [Candidatus Paceibacterota bacterium]